MILVFLTFLSLVLYAGLLLYYRQGWRAIAVFDTRNAGSPKTLISVIIPARNEEANLPALLKSLQEQTYPAANFEVIIVDDHSCDKTAEIILGFPMNNLRLIKLADHLATGINSYKKKAIDLAISKSMGELIVTTDADCIVKKDWLKTLSAFYMANKPTMIIMPVAVKTTRSLLSIFQSLDFMTLQGVTGGAVHHNLHAMCNGANLAYTREIFKEVKGFEGIDSIASGDDMLLMQKINTYKPGSISYLKSPEVIVTTTATETIHEFFQQRIRWASKTSNYNHKPILIVAAIVYFFNVLLLIIPFIALVNNMSCSFYSSTFSLFEIWLYVLAAKILVELFFLYPVARFFKQQYLLIYFPFMQPLHILYTVIAGWLGKFGDYEWKGRKVK